MSIVNSELNGTNSSLISDALVHAQTMAFMVLSISQLFHSFNLRCGEKSIFKAGLFKNKWLNLSFILGIILQSIIVYIPWLADKFHVHSINGFTSYIWVICSSSIA